MEIFFQLANATAAVMTSETLGLDFTLSYQPWPQTITSDGRQNGGNILRINAADGDLTNVDINLYWDRAIDDEFVYRKIKHLVNAGVETAKQNGVWNPYLYLNYAEKWQNPIRGYGKDNIRILKKISKNYDTMRTFR